MATTEFNTTMAQAFADANKKTPKARVHIPTITHISHYGHAVAIKFLDASLMGRAFAAPAIATRGRWPAEIVIREVTASGKYARGVSLVDKYGRVTWSSLEFEERLDPFGHTALPVPPHFTTDVSNLLIYKITIPEQFEFRAPRQPRAAREEVEAAPPSDPFLATWERMTRLEDEVNALLAEHPELTVEVAQPRHRGDPRQIRFRRAQP